ncbi:TPA: hypothetical protein N0F65_010686 [Lagenidium giganteum]|uniref:Transmembrane protein n=1 Tax=Lagenidium giganteum TaxID=4803 RepID=A0AAV2Z5V0_9STRA|nr:TPA: hypothetical protein N0F65_010686 [Lagenidium giganteum]
MVGGMRNAEFNSEPRSEQLQDLWALGVTFIEHNGYYILLACLLLHLARSKYRVYAARKEFAQSWADARDPERVAVLQRETSRVRAEQQQRLLESSRKARKAPPPLSTNIYDMKPKAI